MAISLTTWFRDYVYIPLGGSRVSKAKVIRNTFIIFLVSGFWHGANWTFIAWGAYHAILFLPLILTGKNRKYTNLVAEGRILPTLKETGQMLLTFFLVVLGWILFRSTGMSSCVQYILRIFDTSLFSIPWLLNKEFFMSLFLFILAMLVVEWLQRGKGRGLEMINEKRFAWLRWLVYYSIIILLIRYGMGEEKTFIYFQF